MIFSPKSVQTPNAVLMVRPHHFHPNPETAPDNAFQRPSQGGAPSGVAQRAFAEVSQAAAALEQAGVRVHLFECERADTPDAVFPNNWISTHAGGHVALYPMYCANRRRERRCDVVEWLKAHYRVQDVIDYSGLEHDGLFLEGTGAMVLDHVERVAYACRSQRAHPVALERFATHFNYEPMVFDALDAAGRPVYHTNVLMCIGTAFALIGLDMIPDRKRREHIAQRLAEGGREVLALSEAQIAAFAGNALELGTPHGRVLALSTTALRALTRPQIEAVERSARLLPLHVPTIELAGGSVRCMLAGVHLAPRDAP
ncbi:MAG: citrulline utilization hydrolase CtlX [Rhodoferax sp.]